MLFNTKHLLVAVIPAHPSADPHHRESLKMTCPQNPDPVKQKDTGSSMCYVGQVELFEPHVQLKLLRSIYMFILHTCACAPPHKAIDITDAPIIVSRKILPASQITPGHGQNDVAMPLHLS